MSAESATVIPKNQVDLVDFIDWSGVECLNQKTSHSIPNALKQNYREDDGLNLESDADEQLLIYIPFNQVVKLHSIVVKGQEEDGPKTVKLFSNKEHMGFSNVNDYPPSDTAIFSPDTLKGTPFVLKYVKFQNVRSLTIFIEDNQSGSEVTKVQKIALFGTTIKVVSSPSSIISMGQKIRHSVALNYNGPKPNGSLDYLESVYCEVDDNCCNSALRVETTDMKGLKKIEDH